MRLFERYGRAVLWTIATLALLIGGPPLVAAAAEGAPLGAEQAAAAPAAQIAPRIEFETQTHDFGKATSGEELHTTFGFKNVGDDVLVIERVSGG